MSATVTVYLPNGGTGYYSREYKKCENVTFFQDRIEFDGVYCAQKMHVVTGHPFLYEEEQA